MEKGQCFSANWTFNMQKKKERSETQTSHLSQKLKQMISLNVNIKSHNFQKMR